MGGLELAILALRQVAPVGEWEAPASRAGKDGCSQGCERYKNCVVQAAPHPEEASFCSKTLKPAGMPQSPGLRAKIHILSPKPPESLALGPQAQWHHEKCCCGRGACVPLG